MPRFTTRVVVEGAKSTGELRSRRIAVPTGVVRELRAAGARFPGWLRISVDDGKPLFVFGRRTKSRPSVDVVLPSWRFGKLPSGTVIDVSVESAEPFRAAAGDGQRFDWLDYLPRRRRYFPSQTGSTLTVSYRRDPLTLMRCPDEAAVYWLLGFYQAEGAKRSSNEWSVVSSNPHILRAVRVLLTDKLGVDIERLYLDVLHAPSDDPRGARQEFEDVDVRIAHIRARTPHRRWKSSGGRGAVLHVEKSIVFYKLVMAALRRIFKKGFPSQVAARAFALGWLEGDGSFSNTSAIKLHFHGTPREVTLVVHALRAGLGFSRKSTYSPHMYEQQRSVDIREACKLAVAGAFSFSMNRARLLYTLERKTENIRNLRVAHADRPFLYASAATPGALGGLVGLQLLTRVGNHFVLTTEARRICDSFARLAMEIETLRRFSPSERLGKTGVKSAPYPSELVRFNLNKLV